MKTLLLDTQVVVMLTSGQSRLGSRTRRLIGGMRDRQAIRFNAVSIWEVGYLIAKRRIRLGMALDRWREAVLALGIAEVPASGAIISRAFEILPDHKDMFDRMIVACAILEDATLVTTDATLLKWPGAVLRQNAAE